MKNTLLTLLLFFCTISVVQLSACNGDLIEEETPNELNLIGQVFHFTKPIVYMEFIEEDKKNFTKKGISIGRTLIYDDFQYLFNEHGNHVIQKIPQEMSFTIIDSYWVRQSLSKKLFASDYNMLVLKDENGTLSVCFQDNLVFSNKPELAK